MSPHLMLGSFASAAMLFRDQLLIAKGTDARTGHSGALEETQVPAGNA
ncbi:hypothetical protein [Thalassovita aquimarina]|nr:hypothetical protein [Thalassovita aquimarina]